MIRESLWRRRYSADPGIIGRRLTIGGQPRTVVGIMPDTFEFPSSPELWLPLQEATLGGGESAIGTAVRVFGVLRAGVTFEAGDHGSQRALTTIPSATTRVDEMRVRFRPFAAELDAGRISRRPLWWACSSWCCWWSRATWRRLCLPGRGRALRNWRSAPRSARRGRRVVGQLFLETLLLGSIAAVIGMAGAYALVALDQGFARRLAVLVTLESESAHRAVRRRADVARQRGERPVTGAARDAARSAQHAATAGRGFAFGGFGKVGALLLVVEIALSVALLNGAVTMARAFNAYYNEIPALPKNQILTAQLGRIRVA